MFLLEDAFHVVLFQETVEIETAKKKKKRKHSETSMAVEGLFVGTFLMQPISAYLTPPPVSKFLS